MMNVFNIDLNEDEQAKYLIRLFKDVSDNGWFVCDDFAKNCASACVDIIIASAPSLPIKYYEDTNKAQGQIDYWEKVKLNINQK